jgi:gentisate 1,2-dioxygenase
VSARAPGQTHTGLQEEVMAVQPEASSLSLDEFQQAVRGERLEPLWLQENLLTPEPVTPIQPYHWPWELTRTRMMQAGALVPLGRAGAERRVLALKNPGARVGVFTTQTLAGALQLVHPGEVAPAHRHSAAAIRFIVEGRGTITIVDGEPCTMEPGDLILTPNWTWHSHVNEGDGPIIWLDVLDFPLVMGLHQVFYEQFPSEQQPVTKGRDESLQRYGGALLPTWERPDQAWSPLLSYKWQQTEARLRVLAQVEGSAFDGVALRYSNPFTGGPVLPTMACQVQMLRPGERTRAHRHTTSAIYQVVRGAGATSIDGRRFEWRQGDILALPTWAWHAHENTSASEAAFLFSVTDEPTLRALDLYREQAADADPA